MRIIRIVNISIILISLNFIAHSQENNLVDLFSDQFASGEINEDYHDHVDHSTELKSISSGLFLFYKEFISSQDINACVFSPSCSVYAIESIKKKGFILGLAASFDRISRCNPLAYGYYEIDHSTGLNIDRVE